MDDRAERKWVCPIPRCGKTKKAKLAPKCPDHNVAMKLK
jgi:hypothetical protein